MSFSIDANIAYGQFMEILYVAHRINPAEYTIIVKAFFLDCVYVLGMTPLKVALIDTESNFSAFINVNYPEYVSVRGHC